MTPPRFVVFSEDTRLLKALSRSFHAGRIVECHCPGTLDSKGLGPDSWIIVDPGSLHPCCLEKLRRPRGVLWIGPAASPRPPGKPGEPASSTKALPGARVTPERTAWRNRALLLSEQGRTGRERAMVGQISAHDHERWTVEQAAREVHVCVRHLHRLCRRWFGVPSTTILALARVASVARELLCTDDTLEAIAWRHGFGDREAMTRVFRRFVGLQPRAYRSCCHARANVLIDPEKVRPAGCRKPAHQSIGGLSIPSTTAQSPTQKGGSRART